MKLVKTNKAKDEQIGIDGDKVQRSEFDNYRSGFEIANQVAGPGPASPDRKN